MLTFFKGLFTIERNLPACLAEAVLGPAGVLPEVLLRHVVDPQPHQAVVVGGGALINGGHELIFPVEQICELKFFIFLFLMPVHCSI